MAGSGCCHQCHFDWEEEHCLPYLPSGIQQWLIEEHNALREQGFPPGLVARHADQELAYFQAYCPPELVRKVEADHAKLLAA